MWGAPWECRLSGSSLVNVLSDVLWVCESGLCVADIAKDTKLETEVQVLSLGVEFSWVEYVYYGHVHDELVLCVVCDGDCWVLLQVY